MSSTLKYSYWSQMYNDKYTVHYALRLKVGKKAGYEVNKGEELVAQIIKCKGLWVGKVLPNRKFHLPPRESLTEAMKLVENFINIRDRFVKYQLNRESYIDKTPQLETNDV